ncbi:hypothetical protein EDD86DRAFT_257956 [Gorgonomyces haynaldii]|nr:hypothetical protein EDD86DRAFT_257956 [Gorgonomyces haynaldii]
MQQVLALLLDDYLDAPMLYNTIQTSKELQVFDNSLHWRKIFRNQLQIFKVSLPELDYKQASLGLDSLLHGKGLSSEDYVLDQVADYPFLWPYVTRWLSDNLDRLKARSTMVQEDPGPVLDLGEHLLRKLDDHIACYALEDLNLDYNLLSSLPNTIGFLENLKELHLQCNELRYLPKTIGCLQKLQKLWLNNNQLQELPETMRNLKALETLSLASNRLTKIPDIFDMDLKRCYLNSNLLTSIPVSLQQLKLDFLLLNDNPLVEPDHLSKVL